MFSIFMACSLLMIVQTPNLRTHLTHSKGVRVRICKYVKKLAVKRWLTKKQCFVKLLLAISALHMRSGRDCHIFFVMILILHKKSLTPKQLFMTWDHVELLKYLFGVFPLSLLHHKTNKVKMQWLARIVNGMTPTFCPFIQVCVFWRNALKW